MKIKLILASCVFIALATPNLKPAEPANPTYALMSDFSKAVLAGYFIKCAYKLATTSEIKIFGYEFHKKSDITAIQLSAEMMITAFEILRRRWDGTADCCDAKTLNHIILIKIIGKVIGMRMPIPYLTD
ncbi:MAG: hypothetical protein P4L22_05675 [Candidatus Babeliales bacterium]|nr:hypothetical protein [Candidatus Babeliales bacterium]